jgi:ATP-binding cassette subfamily C protein
VRQHVTLIARLVRWRPVAALVLLIAAGATEGLSLLLLVPLLQFVGLDIGAGATGRLQHAFSAALSAAGLPQTLAIALGLFVLAASLQVMLSLYQSVFHVALEQDIVRRLRVRLYGAIFHAKWTFLAQQRGSDLSHVLTRELDRVGAATAQLAAIVAALFVGAIYIGLAFALSPQLTATILAAGLVLLVALRGRSKSARAAGEEFSRASARLHGAAIEHLSGIKTIKGQSREEKAVSLFSGLSDALAEAHVGAAREYTHGRVWFDLGAVGVLALSLWVAIRVLQMSPAALLLLLFLFARIMPRLAVMQQNVQHYLTLLPSVQAAVDLQARAEAAAERLIEADPRPFTLARQVQFRGVGFQYQDRDAPAVRAIDLTLPAGTTTAIVGPSGGGKSTIADLLMGLLAPNEGIIAVDEEPLAPERLRAWREQIGYVAQDTFLLHDTIRANLLWAQPGATDMEIERALRLASADGFVSALPDGLSTVIGDRGVKLSGGERQRLALARALLRGPALLILDEATSSLDSENERRIQQAIEALKGSMTILVIAHRLSTIRGADMIHVVENGRLVESGQWDALLARPGGRFRQLHAAQDMEGDLTAPFAGTLRA